jgi:hypothetical protein
MQLEISQPAGSAGLITVFDGLLDPEICAKLITRLNTVWEKSHQGKTLGGVDPRTKYTDDLHFSQLAFSQCDIPWNDEWYEMEMHIAGGLVTAVSAYKQQYRHLDSWTEIGDTGFQVQKYHKNWGYYRPHVDSFPGSSVSDRVLGAVIYLCDVEVGGETNFPLHEVSVSAKAGRISLFPAVWTHPHESCVPLSGDKWIISTFVLNEAHDHPPHGDHSHDDNHSHETPQIEKPHCQMCIDRISHECQYDDKATSNLN